MKTLLAGCLLLLLPLNAVAATPAADCPARPGSDDEARALAGQWFAKGEALVSAGDVESGLAAFACSARLVEHPNTIFNMGQAAALLGRDQEALELMRRYIAKDPYGAFVDSARQRIRELEQREAAAAQAQANPPEARPATGATATEPEDGDPGAANGTGPAETPPAEGRSAQLVGRDVFGYALVGVGGAALLAGGALQVLAIRAEDQADAAGRFATYQEHWDEHVTYQAGAIGAFVGGAVFLAGGLVLLLVDFAGPVEAALPDTGPEVTAALLPGGVALTGRFSL